jgi:toxin CcdB
VIRQFDVFANPSLRSRDEAPYVVVLQSHHAGDLPSAVVAPLYRAEAFDVLTKLSVEVRCDDLDLVVSIPELGAISTAMLHRKINNLAAYEDDIPRAVDRLFTGF